MTFRVDVLMDEPLLVRVMQAPRELDRDVEDPFERLLGSALVQLLRADPVSQAAAVDELREDARDAAERADVVAADRVGMQARFTQVSASRTKFSAPSVVAKIS